MLRLAENFWNLLSIAETCWDLLRLAEYYWDLLSISDHWYGLLSIIQNLLRIAEPCWELLSIIETCWVSLRFTEQITTYWDLLRISENFLYWLKKYWKFFIYTQTFCKTLQEKFEVTGHETCLLSLLHLSIWTASYCQTWFAYRTIHHSKNVLHCHF